MKKSIIVLILIIVVIIFMALIFDWGRREVVAPSINSELPIQVVMPKDNQEVKSPIKISGKARGTWFFEGSFPIDLVDSNGNTIASGIATSSENWMTEDFINFSAEISYEKATNTKRVLLVLKKDNPSDNPDLDQNIFIPVILK
ncbi:MAG: Gmad2 immunoglobulin-like domain-containing protein [Candidatus Paceibacterota bacterium]|jgi:hypothetical protein